jgi:sugar phosphate isomerase/epimerase
LKIGLSTWSLLSLDVSTAIRAIGDAGFDYIELWGEVPHAYPGWEKGDRIRDALSSYDFTVTVHAPFTDLNPASPFQPVKGAIEKTLEDFVEFSVSLGAKILTVHPGSVHNEGLVSRSLGSSVATLRKMVRKSGGRIDVNVENQTKSHSMYHFPLASTTESLQLILAEVDGLHFTLDTGHAHANGQDPSLLIERVGDRLTEVHLNDNAGASDDHLVPGEGSAHLQSLLRRIDGQDVLVCLELDPHRYPTDQIIHASTLFRQGSGLLSPGGA